MLKIGPEKRLTPLRHVVAWLKVVGSLCASGTDMEKLDDQQTIMAGELSTSYSESTFTETSAKEIAMNFQHGWPTVVQMRKAIDAWRKEKRADLPPATLMLAPHRIEDPRFKDLAFEEKSWLAFWDRRIVEISAEADAKWDHADPAVRITSKRGNLASLLHTYGGKAWPIIATPFGGGEIPEAAFIRERYENLEPKVEGETDPRRQPRSEDADLY